MGRRPTNSALVGGASAFAVASVWLVHGLYNKLLGGSERHLAIVQSTPGLDTLLTHYNHHHCDARIASSSSDGKLHVAVRTDDGRGDLDVVANLADSALPVGSPFATMQEARRFAGPLPFTFDYEPETHGMVAIKATRTKWMPAPVGIERHRIGLFDQLVFGGHTPVLAAAFHVRDVEYRWGRGTHHRLPR